MRRDDTREGRNMKKTKWRQRLCGTCKWSGVTLCVLLFALWLVSGWCQIAVQWPLRNGSSVELDASEGGVSLFIFTPTRVSELTVGFEFGQFSFDYSYQFSYRVGPDQMWIFFPLWFPLLLIALPIGFLFWSDHRRRTKVGCCEECGYDLTGNTSGTCPECGGPADGSVTPARAAI